MQQAHQKLQETPDERRARNAKGFPEVEREFHCYPGLCLNIPLFDNLTSYAGSWNPFARSIKPERHSVWLLDNTAYQPVHKDLSQSRVWQAEFLVAFFIRNSGKDISRWVAEIADKIGLGQGEGSLEGQATIARRLQPFVDTIQPARYVSATLANGATLKLGPGGRNAISSQTVHLTGLNHDGDTLKTYAKPLHAAPYGSMITHFAGPPGWAVISDIDDSIKVTMTCSPIGILKSTFVSEPTPISGMPELYKYISSTIPPTWFYLSASPYNLYPFLRPFIRQYYPSGTIVLRDASWMTLGGLLQSLTQGTKAYKVSRMNKIHSWLPNRKILCVGDSTQSDPEAYGEIYRKHKGWIKGIFIRKVYGVGEMNESSKNDDERFEKAFHDMPRGVWRTFEEPGEVYAAVDALKGV